MVEKWIGRVAGGDDLSAIEMKTVIDEIMDGKWQPEQIGLLLMSLRAKGETVEEVVGAATSLRQHMTKIHSSHTDYIDTCGTGGDGSGTFNISTAAAIVTAAAGLPVAKHGNRSISSKSGSSDVLKSLGVNIEATVEQVERCLTETGICFCFAPLMHPSMKNVAAVRRSLGVPTIFNMLGPLCNPAGAPFQLLGVGQPELRPIMSSALRALGTQRAVVVCGEDGLDEVTLDGITHVTVATADGLENQTWTPDLFGLERADKSQMQADGPEASAAIIRSILSGDKGPARDIVVMNAAAALWTANSDSDLKACAERTSTAIDSGAAAQLLADLAKASHA